MAVLIEGGVHILERQQGVDLGSGHRWRCFTVVGVVGRVTGEVVVGDVPGTVVVGPEL